MLVIDIFFFYVLEFVSLREDIDYVHHDWSHDNFVQVRRCHLPIIAVTSELSV